ncbi:MAG: hypothetical protein ACI4VF_01580 [Lachnospirales bacterium]
MDNYVDLEAEVMIKYDGKTLVEGKYKDVSEKKNYINKNNLSIGM